LTLRGRGVPVSAIGPKVVYGYDVARIAFALQDLGYTFIPASEPKAADEPETGDEFFGRRFRIIERRASRRRSRAQPRDRVDLPCPAR
jgi:hypothetical protein